MPAASPSGASGIRQGGSVKRSSQFLPVAPAFSNGPIEDLHIGKLLCDEQ